MEERTTGVSKEISLKLLEEIEINLSDFALFLSVMKNKSAHENVLSIILEEPELELKEVHVEEVVLNKSGKRAIRLDAWAVDLSDRHFATEMQNDTEHDDVRKRARFYQGLLDTPVLKSGKETRYRNLPSTVVTFITQEDIFGYNRVKYTFTEQCEEIEGLHLEDGTTKLFLNMSSKNGDPVLVSLLQYMKKTTLENPEIIVKDERIQNLDRVVKEVRQSEEWEAVKMSILSVGMEHGEKIGFERGEKSGLEQGAHQKLKSQILKKLSKGKTSFDIAEELEEELSVIEELLLELEQERASGIPTANHIAE